MPARPSVHGTLEQLREVLPGAEPAAAGREGLVSAQTAFEFPSTPFDLDPTKLCDDAERAVYAALRRGRANARSVPTLAADTGLSTREVQSIVKHLILGHGVPVGTSMGKPYGNFIIDDPEDLKQTTDLLRTRAVHQLMRVAALQKMTHRRLLEEIQTELEAEAKKEREAA